MFNRIKKLQKILKINFWSVVYVFSTISELLVGTLAK